LGGTQKEKLVRSVPDRVLTGAQFRGMRRQLSDLDAKRRQMTAAEHERRR
jgi:hypothetical protein